MQSFHELMNVKSSTTFSYIICFFQDGVCSIRSLTTIGAQVSSLKLTDSQWRITWNASRKSSVINEVSWLFLYQLIEAVPEVTIYWRITFCPTVGVYEVCGAFTVGGAKTIYDIPYLSNGTPMKRNSQKSLFVMD